MDPITQTISKRLKCLLFINRIDFLSPLEKFKLVIDKEDTELVELARNILQYRLHDWHYLLGRMVRESSWNERKKSLLIKGVYSDMYWVSQKKGYVCDINSPIYPELLRQIPDPPIVLYLRGNITCLDEDAISVVGTRQPNEQGKEAAYLLGYRYANARINIISGFAYGIDIAAHLGVIAAHDCTIHGDISEGNWSTKGKAIIVLGTSIDYIYPKAHKQYAAKILEQGGLIVSEIPPNKNTHKINFIGRNRIISGLSTNTIVVQAPEKSGALATAIFALEQGRGVWVHEHGLDEPFKGTQDLYEDGAGLITSNGEEYIKP